MKLKVVGNITLSEKDIQDAVAVAVAKRLGVGVPSESVRLEIIPPIVAGAAGKFEATIVMPGGATEIIV